MKLFFQFISLITAIAAVVCIASAAQINNDLGVAGEVHAKNIHSLITHSGKSNKRIGQPSHTIEMHSMTSQLVRLHGNQQPSSPQGTGTIVGSITYPKRNIRFTTAFGPVDGVNGESAKGDTPFRIASLTKTFTASATFKLIEQGKFTLDTPIKNLLKMETSAQLQAAKLDPETITVRQLLSHRSGLFDYANTEIYVKENLTNPGRKWTRAAQLAIALEFTPRAPDSVYLYTDTNYILLGDIIEKATRGFNRSAQRLLLVYR